MAGWVLIAPPPPPSCLWWPSLVSANPTQILNPFLRWGTQRENYITPNGKVIIRWLATVDLQFNAGSKTMVRASYTSLPQSFIFGRCEGFIPHVSKKICTQNMTGDETSTLWMTARCLITRPPGTSQNHTKSMQKNKRLTEINGKQVTIYKLPLSLDRQLYPSGSLHYTGDFTDTKCEFKNGHFWISHLINKDNVKLKIWIYWLCKLFKNIYTANILLFSVFIWNV